MEELEVVVAHNERATLRVGDVFLKIDTDQTRTSLEVKAMAWRRSPHRGSYGANHPYSPSPPYPAPPSVASASPHPHHQPPGPRQALPPGHCTTRPYPRGPAGTSTNSPHASTANAPGSSPTVSSPHDLVTRNHQIAQAALRPWKPVFTHGDAHYDLAVLTLGHAARWLVEHGFDPSHPGCEFDVLKSRM